MSKKGQMILVIVISTIVWVAGVRLIYNSYETGPRWMDIDRTGKIIGPKNFVEAKSGQLALLTLLCGFADIVVILRAGWPQPKKEQ